MDNEEKKTHFNQLIGMGLGGIVLGASMGIGSIVADPNLALPETPEQRKQTEQRIEKFHKTLKVGPPSLRDRVPAEATTMTDAMLERVANIYRYQDNYDSHRPRLMQIEANLEEAERLQRMHLPTLAQGPLDKAYSKMTEEEQQKVAKIRAISEPKMTPEEIVAKLVQLNKYNTGPMLFNLEHGGGTGRMEFYTKETQRYIDEKNYIAAEVTLERAERALKETPYFEQYLEGIAKADEETRAKGEIPMSDRIDMYENAIREYDPNPAKILDKAGRDKKYSGLAPHIKKLQLESKLPAPLFAPKDHLEQQQ